MQTMQKVLLTVTLALLAISATLTTGRVLAAGTHSQGSSSSIAMHDGTPPQPPPCDPSCSTGN